MIREHDSVVLTRDLPSAGLVAGDVGVVVHVYGGGTAYEVEFVNFDGETIAVESLEAAPCVVLEPATYHTCARPPRSTVWVCSLGQTD
jgi:ATP-dependent exoDNAse (exonuclease V) alpha subunit